MSLNTFKKKSVIKHGSKRSGSAPGGYWLPQGPFGHATESLKLSIENYGQVGFSINGGHRNIGGVGKDMKMSKSGTPYRGTQPIGFGGTYGRYPSATLIANSDSSTGCIPNAQSKDPVVDPVLNSRVVNTMGNQYRYIKPSVLSTYGLIDKKYRWAKYGKYPNYWVQPNYTGNLSDSASQGLYIQNKASENTCSLDVNNVAIYIGNTKGCGPYTKTLYQPVSYTEYNLNLTKKCYNPSGPQKPFPFAVQTGTGQNVSGTSVRSFGNSCNTSQNIYLSPPDWYIKS